MSWEIRGVSSEKLGRRLGAKKIALGGTVFVVDDR
jgi:hypothetical protein